MTNTTSRLDQLQRAAADVVSILQTVGEYADAKIAVIGGLAVWKYNPAGRTTEDVDFLVTIMNAPNSVKEKLLSMPDTSFEQRAQYFYYKSPDGANIQIDLTSPTQAPYVPSGAMTLRDVTPGAAPFIDPLDLLVFKIFSCGLRAEVAKRIVDAEDANSLAMLVTANGPVELTPQQRSYVEPGIDDVVQYGFRSKTWWTRQLGLSLDA